MCLFKRGLGFSGLLKKYFFLLPYITSQLQFYLPALLPEPLFLHFPLQKRRLSLDINQTWCNKSQEDQAYTSYEGWMGYPVRGKGSKDRQKSQETSHCHSKGYTKAYMQRTQHRLIKALDYISAYKRKCQVSLQFSLLP